MNRVKEFRQGKKLSQLALAKEIGVARKRQVQSFAGTLHQASRDFRDRPQHSLLAKSKPIAK